MNAPASCRRRSDCRLCRSTRLEPAFSLTPTPPANAFVTESERDVSQTSFPLDLFLCADCGHFQLLDVVNPAALFEDYVYVSGTSPVFVEHFRRYAKRAIALSGAASGDLVVDIGSNDGTLLRFFKEFGLRVLGVDPAKEIAARANAAGLETWTGFFTPSLSLKILREKGPATLVTANNVFAHADDLRGMATAARDLLASDGLFVFETSYLADVYEKTLFDTIYHEHLSYHSVAPLLPFFESLGMQLVEAERVDTHGGSLRGVAQKAGGRLKVGASVTMRLEEEARLGLTSLAAFASYAARIGALKTKLLSVLTKFKAGGKRLAAFGAPAKATTLMHHFGIDGELVDFIIDDSPLKQGLYSPGLHIPVLPSSAVAERRPEGLLVTAWNFADPIIAKNKAFLDGGGTFIVPLPRVKIIE